MARLNNEKGILTNSELLETGEKFSIALQGYELYLIKKNYGVISDTLHSSTARNYAYAIERVMREEGLSFVKLYERAAEFEYTYGTEGPKRKLGDTSKGTWRNAIKQLHEFKKYNELREKKDSPYVKPAPVCTVALEVGSRVEHKTIKTLPSRGKGTVVALDAARGCFTVKFDSLSEEIGYTYDAFENGRLILIV